MRLTEVKQQSPENPYPNLERNRGAGSLHCPRSDRKGLFREGCWGDTREQLGSNQGGHPHESSTLPQTTWNNKLHHQQDTPTPQTQHLNSIIFHLLRHQKHSLPLASLMEAEQNKHKPGTKKQEDETNKWDVKDEEGIDNTAKEKRYC